MAETGGSSYWRSMEERAAPCTGHARAFPEGAWEWSDPAGRRQFLKLAGATLALAGLNACASPPSEPIVPYVDPPPGVVPGHPQFFASAFLFGGYAQGILVESHMGRPTKIEGNPDHPASLGATSAFAQASILDLYDPDRSTVPLRDGEVATREAFLREMQASRVRHRQDGGRALRLLTETVTSPTLAAQIQALLTAFPEARWHVHDPLEPRHQREGLRQALGRSADPVYHLDQADIILSFDGDFLVALPGSLRYARDFADRRRVRESETAMNRLYAVESAPTITGAMADHRLPLRPSQIEHVVYALAAGLGVTGTPPHAIDLPYLDTAWLPALLRDLQHNPSRCLIVAGETLPPRAHTLIHHMNEQLGAIGSTLAYIDPVAAQPEQPQANLPALVRDMQAGRVETLMMLGGNPAYTAPADVPFAQALAEVPMSVHLGRYVDETSALSRWHVPEAHYLEAWSDAHAYDGTPTILQPLIAPLYDACRSAHEVLSVVAGSPQPGYNLVRSYWQQHVGADAFDTFWQQVLYDGVVRIEDGGARAEDSEATPSSNASPLSSDVALPALTEAAAEPAGMLEIVFRPDPTLWDGRFATNSWLQELPKPITKLVWDNAALVSPATARRLGVENEQVVELEMQGRAVRAPIWIVPGHADRTVTAYLGHGRERAGLVGSGVGFNAYRLRTTDHLWTSTALAVRPLDEHYPLVTTQQHHSMEGWPIVEETEIEQFRENPDFIHGGKLMELPTLYPEYDYPNYKWGMVIDVNTCIGCNACITACQAENNIPVVGKDEVRRGREMHWLRVDRYYKGDLDNPDTYFQPVPCMHCEKAPCEVVCPTYATVHDHEGLNVMVYNRCIGTRYCSNNCPYKVRRFNFLQYADWTTESLKLQRNPEVTVLFASFAAIIGFFVLNRLPKPYHPVFNVPRFARASQDRFFLCIEATDPKFDVEKTRRLLVSFRPANVYDVED